MLPTLGPYKIDIQQGNVVTQEMVSKLKPGMTRNQVRFILGTPLVVDPFHADRWDYVYLFQKGGGTPEQRRIAVIFQGDKLVRVEGDVVPARTSPVPDAAKGAGPAQKPVAPPVRKDAEQPAAPQTAAPQPPPASPDAAVSDAAKPGAAPGSADTQTPKPDEPAAANKDKPKEERGFFGRMLEKLGF